MALPSPRTLAVVLVDLLLLAVSVTHIPSLQERSRVPFRFEMSGGRVVVQETDTAQALSPGDAVLTWERVPVHGEHDLEFLADYRRIGDRVDLEIEREGVRRSVSVVLVPSYSHRYVIITTVVGVFTWCVGVFVILARPRQRTAAVLHWSLLCMGMVTMLMLGRVEPDWFRPYLARALFFVTYAGVAAFFLHFTFLFPVPAAGPSRRNLFLLYLMPAVLAGLLFLFNARAVHRRSLGDYAIFNAFYDVFHVLLIVYVFWGLWNFIRAYTGTHEPDERKKLKWLLWGLAIGPVPFLVCITIPELVVTTSPVPEDITLLPLAVIPLAFAISFVRYQVLDIEIVIQRTTVYTIVLAMLVVAYAGVVWLASSLVGIHSVETSAVAAVLVGLAFEPARRRVQKFVDRRFFFVRYDFRRTERRLVEEIDRTFDPGGLGTLLIARIPEVIPVDRIAFLASTEPGGALELFAHRGFEDPLPERLAALRTAEPPGMPVGVRDRVEAGVPLDQSEESLLKSAGAALAFPLRSGEGVLLGMLLLGRKRSGARFSAEDVDLLSNISSQAALVLERVTLHAALIREQTEAERLHVLNEMKSEIVSNVSHELRTPLTSIRMFSEMLEEGRAAAGRKGREYLQIIREETGRLDRLVSTVLDAAMIERGGKTYVLRRIDLADAVRDAFGTMRYQLKANGFTARLTGCSPRQQAPAEADRDAVVQAVINLLGNAIKHSVRRRRVHVALTRTPTTCRISVADRGEGITPESREHLFRRFYRDPDTQTQGFGIGLAVVKHIMDAHGGTIEVDSTPGKGSTFTLVFPLSGGAQQAVPQRPQRRSGGRR